MEPIALPTLPGQAARVHPARRAARHRLGADAAAAHAAGRTTPRPQRCTACCHEPAQHNLLRHPQFLDKAHCTHTPCATCVMREHELRPFHSRSARDTSGSARGHATKPQKPRSRDRDAMPTSHGNKVACNAWLRAPRARTPYLPLAAQRAQASPTGCSDGASPTGRQPRKANEKPKQAIHSHTTAIHSHSQPPTAIHSHTRPSTVTHSHASEHAATAACTSDTTRPPLGVAPTGAAKRRPAASPRACECYPPPPPTGNGGGGSPPPQPTKRAGAPCHHLTEGGGGPRSQAQADTRRDGEPLRKGRVRKYPAAPLRTAPPLRPWRAWTADGAT